MNRGLACFAGIALLCCITGIAARDKDRQTRPQGKIQEQTFKVKTELVEVRAAVNQAVRSGVVIYCIDGMGLTAGASCPGKDTWMPVFKGPDAEAGRLSGARGSPRYRHGTHRHNPRAPAWAKDNSQG